MSDTNNGVMAPIAITGISALFPSSTDARLYWRNIVAGKDLISEVPPGHWLAEDYCDPEKKLHILSNRGGFLPDVPFDPIAFGIPPNDLEAIDTAQLLALLVVQRLFSETISLKEERIDKDKISVILGVAGGTELIGEMASKIQRPVWVEAMRAGGLAESKVQELAGRIENAYQDWSESTFPGLLGNVVAGRIANRFNLGGTNCVVDAACASSLAAVSMAIQELQLGHADMVITGGVDALNDNFMYMCFSRTPAMSPTGNCRPFSAEADGTLLGEGLGMFSLRRLEDAERDGDPIYAVIRGVGTSSDGRARSVYSPNPEGQAKALRRAYDNAGYGPDEVEMVEAHGTATRAGDLAEFQGLSLVFDQPGSPRCRCALGSVKSQIGHTKSAAGAASLIKAAMSLHHKILPPTIKIDAPNPILKVDESPFYLNTHARPWIRTPQTTRKASVSSFGFGGSNFHITLEEYTGNAPHRIHCSPKELFLFSGDHLTGLQAALKSHDCSTDSFFRGARQSQANFNAIAEFRLSVMASDAEDLNRQLKKCLTQLNTKGAIEGLEGVYFATAAFEGKIAFLFPGQGSQYMEMGAGLAMEFPAARKIWDHAASVEIGGQYLQDVVFPPPCFDGAVNKKNIQQLNQTEWTQPAIGTCSAANLELLKQLGLKADAMAGHSYGELTALYAAGVIPSYEVFLGLSRQRGEAMAAAATTPGAMTAVFSNEIDLTAKVNIQEMGLTVANFNSPKQTVIAGPKDRIADLEKALGPLRIRFSRLAVATAFHTPMVANAVKPFNDTLEKTELSTSDCAVYSNVTGETHGRSAASVRELLAEQLVNPVRFTTMLNSMHADGIRLFIELGPGNILSRLVTDTLEDRAFDVLSFDRRSADGVERFWDSVARLSVMGIKLDLRTIWADCHEACMPEDGSPASVMINGGNIGRPYPPKEGADARQSPNPEQALRQPETAPAPNREVPDHAGPQADPSWHSAIDTLQRNSFEAHRLYQETLTDAHISYLNSSQSLLEQLENPSAVREPSVSAPQMPAMPQVPAPESFLASPSAAPEPPVAEVLISPGADPSSDLLSVILTVVAEKTGYPAEMLDLEAPMEAELGIDSIKRVEILSALQDVLPQLADVETSRLAAMNTLGEILNYVKSQTPSATAAALSPPSTASDVAPDLKTVILDVVAEKTGYPAEMLDLEAPMEAELGIDSIKRVEILSALQDALPQLADVETSRLAAMNTLGEILNYVKAQTPSATAAVPSPPSTSSDVAPDLKTVILDVVAEKTGYPAEMLDLDAPMEAELGIDSIKRVEILSALQEQIPKLADVDTTQLAAMNTLGEILDYARSGAADTMATPEHELPAAESKAPDLQDLMIHSVQARTAEPCGISASAFWSGNVTILNDSQGFAQAMSAELKKRQIRVEVVDTVPADCTNLILPASFDTNPHSVDQYALKSFQALRACGASISQSNGHLLFLMNGSGTFCPQNPWTAGTMALARTAAQEWPDVTVKVIDLEFSDQTHSTLAAAVSKELCYGGPELEVGLRADGRRYSMIDHPIDLPDITPLSPEDVVVVSGGARGVTAECMVALAQAAAYSIAILGRSKIEEETATRNQKDSAEIKKVLLEEAKAAGQTLTPIELNAKFYKLKAGREVKANLTRLQALGCRVRYIPVDVVDFDSVAAACNQVRRELGPITGLVHAAGVLADKLIQDKTDQQFKMVYNTKVKGLRNLLEACSDDPLKRICCFSSAAARTGNAGQSDYAMGNEILNKVCRRLSTVRPECRVVSIQWGPWEGGMVTPELVRHFQTLGVPLIPLKSGAACFAKLFTQPPGAPCEVVVGPYLPTNRHGSRSWDVIIDPHNTPELADHCIQGAAVVPVVMASRWCQQIAASRHPGKHISAVCNLEVIKGLRLPDFGVEEQRLRIECQHVSDERLEFKIFSIKGRLHYRLHIDMADEPPAPAEIQCCDGAQWPWSEEEVYVDGKLFHGPRFQVIKKMKQISDRGCSALLTNINGDMSTLDGGLQLALLWRLQQDGKLTLPLGFEALKFHRPFADKDSVHCELQVADNDVNRTIWDVHYRDDAGEAIATMSGLHMFSVPSNRV